MLSKCAASLILVQMCGTNTIFGPMFIYEDISISLYDCMKVKNIIFTFIKCLITVRKANVNILMYMTSKYNEQENHQLLL